MSANAQNQVERMLALVPYLRVREGIAVDAVAKDFGVPPSQIVKDLKVLWYCGLPNSVTGDMIDIDMEALDEGGVVKLSNADYLACWHGCPQLPGFSAIWKSPDGELQVRSLRNGR